MIRERELARTHRFLAEREEDDQDGEGCDYSHNDGDGFAGLVLAVGRT